MSQEDFWNYKNFRAKYLKEKLSLVYEKIERGTELSKPELLWQDDLGLTPLHYALVLRKDDVVRSLLNTRDWSEYVSPMPKDKMVDVLYNPVFLTSILYDDMDMIEDVYVACSKEAKPLIRSIKRMDSFIYIQRKMLHDHPEEAMNYACVIAEYEDMRYEMQQELSAMAKSKMTEYRKTAAVIIEANHPYAKYLLHMYLTKDAIFYSISDTISDYRLYKYKDRYFLASLQHNLDLSFFEWKNGKVFDHKFKETDTDLSIHQTDQKEYYDGDTFENPDRRAAKEKEREERKKKFEEARRAFEESLEISKGWFSAEAHGDINVLKKEYRLLVKTYHPDVTGNKSATSIMQQIQLERARILENLNI